MAWKKTSASQALLGAEGPFAKSLPGFKVRESQLALAAAIETALSDTQIVIAEAGTGIGKTFAYLVPALMSGKKIIISTGTKNLQEQLFHRDLPRVRDNLKIAIRTALLKGRANYLCLYRLENHLVDGRFHSQQLVAELNIVQDWANYTKQGEIAELTDISEDSKIWPFVTSTKDNCLGQECPLFAKCHLQHARRRAQEAEVLVINHHLFFADFSLRDEGVGELLPSADAIIFDEAHQLPEIATHFLGTSLSSRQLMELARDTQVETLQQAKDMQQLIQMSDRLQKAVLDMRLAFNRQAEKKAWHEVAKRLQLQQAVSQLKVELESLQEMLKLAAVRSKGLENCWQRSEALNAKLALLTNEAAAGQIHWFETFSKSFTLHLTPMSVAEEFGQHLTQQAISWVFTSATLSVANSFEHFAKELGIENATAKQFESPFDYQQQALMYIPRGLPDPREANYLTAVIDAAVPVIKASGGRTFFLFTSHRNLQTAAEVLPTLIDYPVLVQGSMPKTKLIEKFCELGNAVLLGTSSFWEGVDVRGDNLSCVIIDKLPFASPGDPILSARIKTMKNQGQNPFFDYQLPIATIALKQGAGRLIRDTTDTGILMLCDPRLLARSYGKDFFSSLPKMPRTRDLQTVQDFFNA